MFELFCRLCFWFPPSKLYLINCLKKMLMEHLQDFRPHKIVSQVWNSIQNMHSPCKRPPIPLSTHVWVWRDPITSSFGAIFKVILYLGGRCMENSCFRRRTARIFTNRGDDDATQTSAPKYEICGKIRSLTSCMNKRGFFLKQSA